MNYASIKSCDIANGPGVRVSLFVSGCTHHCKDCFNEEAWDFSYGEPFTDEVSDRLLAMLCPDYIRGITYLGGEPFDPHNQESLLLLRAESGRSFRKSPSGRSQAMSTAGIFRCSPA